MAKNPIVAPDNQGDKPQLVASQKKTGRRRKSGVSRGALDALDLAVETLGTTEEPSRDWQITRPDAQDEFAIRTRRLVRQLQGELRRMLADINGRAA